MRIGPTLSGGLKLLITEERDWFVLLGIAEDADGDLAKHFASLMDEDSMWEDIVVPELESDFSKQRETVLKMVVEAKKAEEEEVVIERTDAEAWYGALNQARLVMEERYQFGPRELREPEEIQDSEMRSAYFRNDFYCTVQSLLLQYVMDEV